MKAGTFWALMLFCALCPAFPCGAADSHKVVIAASGWSSEMSGGDLGGTAGFAREVLARCLGDNGYAAEFRSASLRLLPFSLQMGDIDIAILPYQAGRESFLLFGKEPLFTAGQRPVLRRGTGITIRALADFDGLRLGHCLSGFGYSPEFAEYLQMREAKGLPTLATTTAEGLKLLVDDRVDVLVGDRAAIVWRAGRMGLEEAIEIGDFDGGTEDFFIALSRNSRRLAQPRLLVETVDACVAGMKTDGGYLALAEEYGMR